MMKYLKLKLEEKYGLDVFIVGEAGRPGLFCFKRFTEHVLTHGCTSSLRTECLLSVRLTDYGQDSQRIS